METVVRSSRSCGYLTVTAIAIMFTVAFITIITLIILGLTLSVTLTSICFFKLLVKRFFCVLRLTCCGTMSFRHCGLHKMSTVWPSRSHVLNKHIMTSGSYNIYDYTYSPSNVHTESKISSRFTNDRRTPFSKITLKLNWLDFMCDNACKQVNCRLVTR